MRKKRHEPRVKELYLLAMAGMWNGHRKLFLQVRALFTDTDDDEIDDTYFEHRYQKSSLYDRG